ncbi:hypothetical protein ACWKW6_28685 [Dyadobacter jiangsuensis]
MYYLILKKFYKKLAILLLRLQGPCKFFPNHNPFYRPVCGDVRCWAILAAAGVAFAGQRSWNGFCHLHNNRNVGRCILYVAAARQTEGIYL